MMITIDMSDSKIYFEIIILKNFFDHFRNEQINSLAFKYFPNIKLSFYETFLNPLLHKEVIPLLSYLTIPYPQKTE